MASLNRIKHLQETVKCNANWRRRTHYQKNSKWNEEWSKITTRSATKQKDSGAIRARLEPTNNKLGLWRLPLPASVAAAAACLCCCSVNDAGRWVVNASLPLPKSMLLGASASALSHIADAFSCSSYGTASASTRRRHLALSRAENMTNATERGQEKRKHTLIKNRISRHFRGDAA